MKHAEILRQPNINKKQPSVKDVIALAKVFLLFAVVIAVLIAGIKTFKAGETNIVVATTETAPMEKTATAEEAPAEEISAVSHDTINSSKKSFLQKVKEKHVQQANIETPQVIKTKALVEQATAAKAALQPTKATIKVDTISKSKIANAIAGFQIDGIDIENLAEVIAKTSAKHDIDPLLATAIVYTESTFNARAVGPTDKHGLMQISIKEAKDLAKGASLPYLGKVTLYHPHVNTDLGLYKFKTLLDTFHGEVDKALLAYVGGSIAASESSVKAPTTTSSKYKDKVLGLYLKLKKA